MKHVTSVNNRNGQGIIWLESELLMLVQFTCIWSAILQLCILAPQTQDRTYNI
jgi:hypothetical protein